MILCKKVLKEKMASEKHNKEQSGDPLEKPYHGPYIARSLESVHRIHLCPDPHFFPLSPFAYV
jgi:hypothetical protein